MGNGKLAIILPTYRFDATARHCIETVAGMASDEIDVFIGDNSCNPEKWAFLRSLSARSPQCHTYCHEENLGAEGNWNFLMGRQQHEFMCMVSDDDMYSPDYFLAGLAELKVNPSCAAASGFFLVMAWRDEQLRFEVATSNAAGTPAARIANYATFSGFNAAGYAVHRRAALADFNTYMRERPFFPPYMDQFKACTLLAQGTHVVHQRRQMFVYNNNNWNDRETVFASNAKYYVEAGFPEAFSHLHLLCWAVEIVHYFNSIYRPAGLGESEAQAIVRTLFDRLMRQLFRAYLLENMAAVVDLFGMAPEGLKVLRALIETDCTDPLRLMAHFVAILRVFHPDLADRYATFAARSWLPTVTARAEEASAAIPLVFERSAPSRPHAPADDVVAPAAYSWIEAYRARTPQRSHGSAGPA